MPTIKLDINTGLEYSPTDGLDSAVKLHNFTVGADGSLYKLPALKNLANTLTEEIDEKDSTNKLIWNYRLIDIKKFQTASLDQTLPQKGSIDGKNYSFHQFDIFRRFVYITTASYGVANIDYKKNRKTNQILKTYSDLQPEDNRKIDIPRYGEFEYKTFKYEPDTAENIDLSHISSEVVVDFNAQFDNKTSRKVEQYTRAIFPMQRMNSSTKDDQGYVLTQEPKNMITCPLRQGIDTSNYDSEFKFLSFNNSEYTANDINKGPVTIGDRMFFYSELQNAIKVSTKDSLSVIMQESVAQTIQYIIAPLEEVQNIAEFNGNLVVFTPTGIDRMVLNPGEIANLLVRDPTFKYSYRVRPTGAWTKVNKQLFFYTDESKIYSLNFDLSVTPLFPGPLPIYTPLQDYLQRDSSTTMATFDMLGCTFVSVGPWLYNMTTQKWSTYSYDGWENPIKKVNPPAPIDPSEPPLAEEFVDTNSVVWANETAKRTISAGFDDIVCTYSTVCTPLTYEEMQEGPPSTPPSGPSVYPPVSYLVDQSSPSLKEGEYQWGKVAFFTTRVFQQVNIFSIDKVIVYVRGVAIKQNEKLWLKVLMGTDNGDFDINDESTYGKPVTYQPINPNVLGGKPTDHVGQFIWEGMNIKCNRFRLQVVSTSKTGIVIQSAFADITTLPESESRLLNHKQQEQKEEK